MHDVRSSGGPATHQADPNDDALVSRVRAEFLEMPGLQLTPAQATRLWGLEPAACERVIDALVGCDFLRWTSAGTITRAE